MLPHCPRERGQDWDAKAHVGQRGKYVRLEFSLQNSCATSVFTAGYCRPLPNDDFKHSVKKTSCAVICGGRRCKNPEEKLPRKKKATLIHYFHICWKSALVWPCCRRNLSGCLLVPAKPRQNHDRWLLLESSVFDTFCMLHPTCFGFGGTHGTKLSY